MEQSITLAQRDDSAKLTKDYIKYYTANGVTAFTRPAKLN